MKTSLTSKALNWLGCTFIGTPESLVKKPADFYYEKGDRDVPTVAEMNMQTVQAKRIRNDAFRRALTMRVSILVSILTLLICSAGYVVVGAKVAIKAGPEKAAPLSASEEKEKLCRINPNYC